MSKQRKSTMPSVHAKPIQRKHAAGIDIGATSIYVAFPADRDPQSVHSFQTFTEDLHRLADWLQRLPDQNRGDGVYGSVLGTTFPNPGTTRLRGVSGQRASCKERARPEDRRIRLSVAAIPAFGGVAASLISTSAPGLCATFPAAAS